MQGQRIVIEHEEVLPGRAITLGQLLDRIEAPSIDIRATLDTTSGFPRIVISQFNPVSQETPLLINDGTSNFFETAGLITAPVEQLLSGQAYQNSLRNFRINPIILQDLDAIAAAGDDGLGFRGPGDNRTALAIADLKFNNKAIDNTTFGEYYQSTISSLGSAAQTVQRSFFSQSLVVDQLHSRREEISGVNLDEEAVNLIRYQRAFEASARVMTVLDEVLSLIVNRMGISGR
ncbi:hypothetical protein IIA79_04545 [bacterium]|nr:hypothetical protein [bacterium]